MWKTNKEEELRGLFNGGLSNIEIAGIMGTTEDAIRNKLKRLGLVREVKSYTPKVLLLDIETSLMEIYSFGIHEQVIGIDQIKNDWNIICWSAKWLFDEEVMSDSLTRREALNKDDKRIVKSMWDLLNEADVVVGHNCLDVNTPVLKTDLTWCKAGELKEGDKLVGFDENNSKNSARQIKESIVTSNFIEKVKTFKVTFDNGDEIIATPEHKWLKLAPKGREYRWCETKNLKVGQRVEKFMNPWVKDESYKSGWLSGFISGEGTLKGDSKRGLCCNSIDFCQRPGVTWEKSLEYCNDLGIELAEGKVKKGGLGKGDTLYTYTKGGKFKVLEILGKLGIDRLINKINFNKFGSLKSQISTTSTIIKIEDAGYNDVSVLSTSTKTYFGGGYPMHNCDKFDIPKLKTRFLKHGLNNPSPFQTIDTLKIARKEFKVTSNKLDYLCRFLGLNVKVETGGIELWKQCGMGNEEAIETMSNYCDNDVLILEELYLKIRSYASLHTNLGMYVESDVPVCPKCLSTELVWGLKYYTGVNEYSAARCKCGAIVRMPVSQTSKNKKARLLK